MDVYDRVRLGAPDRVALESQVALSFYWRYCLLALLLASGLIARGPLPAPSQVVSLEYRYQSVGANVDGTGPILIPHIVRTRDAVAIARLVAAVNSAPDLSVQKQQDDFECAGEFTELVASLTTGATVRCLGYQRHPCASQMHDTGS